MSFFVQPTPPPTPRTKHIRTISLAFASVLVVMAVAQLFTFEKFPDVISGWWLPGGEVGAQLFAGLLVTFEVIALPFLLSMRLSLAMRILSMVAGWVVVATWLVIVLWQNMTMNVIANSGLLGATVPLSVGWWSVLCFMGLGIVALWASWGMGPLGKKYKE